MEREGTSKKCRPGLAHGLFEALDRHGQRQQEDQMAKAVKTSEVARVIRWLCTEDADPISGAAIPVYGRS